MTASTRTQHPKRKTDRSAEAAFRSLVRTCGLLRRVMQPYFLSFGISGAQCGILRTLQRAEQDEPAGLRLTDLCQRLLVRPPSITGVVDRLSRMGLVARVSSSEDLRVKRITLTPAGRQLIERVMEGHGARVRAFFGGLTAAEQGQLEQLLDRLAAHLEELAEGGDDAADLHAD